MGVYLRPFLRRAGLSVGHGFCLAGLQPKSSCHILLPSFTSNHAPCSKRRLLRKVSLPESAEEGSRKIDEGLKKTCA